MIFSWKPLSRTVTLTYHQILGERYRLLLAAHYYRPSSPLSALDRDEDARSLCPVRAENRIHGSDQQSCSPGTSPVMITVHVPAVRVPADHAASRVAAAV